jgi:hypothetical protein
MASGLKESQQVGIDLVFQCRAHAVGRTRIDLESRIFDEGWFMVQAANWLDRTEPGKTQRAEGLRMIN